MDKKKVGILGGTFDPIHLGHLILAENAYSSFDLDVVLIMPSGNPPHKNSCDIISKEHRNFMVQLAIDDNRHFKISLFEQERAGLIYTADTLKLLKENNKDCDYYFIVGGDSLISMEKWYRPERIFANAVILAAVRDNVDDEVMKKQADFYTIKYNADIRILKLPAIEISSSVIRDRVKAGKSIKYMVPKDVERYIYNNRLYMDR